MNLMISESISRPALERTRINAEIETISYAMSVGVLGERLVARSIKGACAILMGSDQEKLEAELAARFPKANLIADEAVVHDDLAKVVRFMDKPTNRDLEEMMAERGLSVDHVTIWRWVQHYAPILNQRLGRELQHPNRSWRVDETYVRVAGNWAYLYRQLMPPATRLISCCRPSGT